MMPPFYPQGSGEQPKKPSRYATKLPRCMTPGCSKCATHGLVKDRDTPYRWCVVHKEVQHVLLIEQ